MTPRIGFVIGGVQKGGTTALASFLAAHPDVALPSGKEAHVFDAPDFDDAWSAAQVDARYAAHFASRDDGMVRLHGDATPLYCFHPLLVQRIARYNPAMRWILILRDPVERAISHYNMERARGDESWPMWAAMLLEPWRLRAHWHDFSSASPLRRHSYRSRGDYARQLDVLLQHFPRGQLLLLRNAELAGDPEQVMRRVWIFLGLRDPGTMPTFGRVFEGGHGAMPAHAPVRRLLQVLLRRPMADAERRHGIRW